MLAVILSAYLTKICIVHFFLFQALKHISHALKHISHALGHMFHGVGYKKLGVGNIFGSANRRFM
jgi:hypothetical protein